MLVHEWRTIYYFTHLGDFPDITYKKKIIQLGNQTDIHCWHPSQHVWHNLYIIQNEWMARQISVICRHCNVDHTSNSLSTSYASQMYNEETLEDISIFLSYNYCQHKFQISEATEFGRTFHTAQHYVNIEWRRRDEEAIGDSWEGSTLRSIVWSKHCLLADSIITRVPCKVHDPVMSCVCCLIWWSLDFCVSCPSKGTHRYELALLWKGVSVSRQRRVSISKKAHRGKSDVVKYCVLWHILCFLKVYSTSRLLCVCLIVRYDVTNEGIQYQ